MSAEQRDFSDFFLGDNVYELANGLIPEVAERLEVVIGDEPTSEGLQAIMEQVGKNEVLRENADITAFDREEMADLVERAGVQKALSRSLYDPADRPDEFNVQAHVIMGAVANWQDRMLPLLSDLPEPGYAYVLTGNRTMDSVTEKSNPNIVSMWAAFGRYPTEAEYAGAIITPKLVELDWTVMPTAFATGNADEIFGQFFEQNPELLNASLAVGRVANAGVVMAVQLRDAARRFDPQFDTDLNDPQVYVLTDTFPVARTEEQDNDPAHYQKAATALRQTVLTAKKLHETHQDDLARLAASL